MSEDWQDTLTAADLSLEVSRECSISTKAPTIPGYQLQDVLGRGTFGQVYRAVQNSTGQVVAVKILHSVNAGFRKELERLSQVSDHPHIVTLVDASLDFDPPFLVTPYLPGSLQDHVPTDSDQIDIDRIVGWFETLVRTLQFVHQRGILHGDLKPANVLLGEDEQPRLVDFGQSVELQGEELRLGSFWFMPADQARLPGQESSLPRVDWDLHALGATIYTLLTGRFPRAEEAYRETLSKLDSAQQKVTKYRELYQRASLRPVRELSPSVDPELAAIVEACLGREGYPTYSSAGEVLNDLNRRSRQLPVAAMPATGWYPLRRFISRNRFSVGVATLALVVLLSGLAWASHRIYLADRARQSLVTRQYERGLKLLEKGRASGLVWLLEAHQQSPSPAYLQAVEEHLADQLTVAEPALYRLPTQTAPSPSGTRGVIKGEDGQFRQIDLTNGALSPLPPDVPQRHLDRRDNVRYLLDGIVLDPEHGSGGPAVWHLPPFGSISPAEPDATLCILVRPDRVLRALRSPAGFHIVEASGKRVFEAERENSSSPSPPTFSLQGDLAVSWDDPRVELYSARSGWKPVVIAESYCELLRFSSDGRWLAGHDGDSQVTVWNREGKVIASFELGATANEMVFDQSGRLLVCVTRDGLVHGYDLDRNARAWSPAQLEKPALWVLVQPDGQIVTMSDEVTVWRPPGMVEEEAGELSDRVARRTGWVYDRNSQVRTLTRSEYLQRFKKDS